jgi:hypothetical protein
MVGPFRGAGGARSVLFGLPLEPTVSTRHLPRWCTDGYVINFTRTTLLDIGRVTSQTELFVLIAIPGEGFPAARA